MQRRELNFQKWGYILKASIGHPTSATNCQANIAEIHKKGVGTTARDEALIVSLHILDFSRLIFISALNSGAIDSVPKVRDKTVRENLETQIA